MKKAIKSLRQEARNTVKDMKVKNPFGHNLHSKHFNELREDGITKIKDYYTKDQCSAICSIIDELIIRYADQVRSDSFESDHRIFGANLISEEINKFFTDPFIRSVVHSYEAAKEVNGFTLAARLNFKEGNPGSGGGWHRDSAQGKQTKSLIYLSDTDINHGPFQFFKGSHKPLDVIRKQFKYNFEYNQFRFKDEEIAKLSQENAHKLLTVTGEAGTMILVDTRGIHRGMPILAGERYALTNYFWADRQIPEHIKKIIIKP